MGLLANSTKGLGMVRVRGRRRVPKPGSTNGSNKDKLGMRGWSSVNLSKRCVDECVLVLHLRMWCEKPSLKTLPPTRIRAFIIRVVCGGGLVWSEEGGWMSGRWWKCIKKESKETKFVAQILTLILGKWLWEFISSHLHRRSALCTCTRPPSFISQIHSINIALGWQ